MRNCCDDETAPAVCVTEEQFIEPITIRRGSVPEPGVLGLRTLSLKGFILIPPSICWVHIMTSYGTGGSSFMIANLPKDEIRKKIRSHREKIDATKAEAE